MTKPPEKSPPLATATRHRIRAMAIICAANILLFHGANAKSPSQNEKEPLDPFSQLSQKNWVSPDKYEKQAPPPEPETPEPSTISAQPKAPTNSESTNKATSSGQQSQPNPPADQNPQQEKFGLEISSTAENAKLPIPLPPDSVNGGQNKRYEPGWMESAATARRQAFIESAKGWAPYKATPSTSLRLSYLPGKVPPITQPNSQPPATPAQPEKKPAKSDARNPGAADAKAPDLETWTKAIKDYKTKQMEAIQSDRQTLEALQAAIKELGLQKELNFDSSLQLSPVKQETPSSDKKDGAKRSP